MKRKSLVFLLALMITCTSVFAMGYPGQQEPNRPKEVDDTRIKGTGHPFSMSIDNPSIDLVTDPGSASSGRIMVENNGLKPLNIRIYAADWTYSDDGSKAFHDAGSTKYSCADWIHLNPREMILEPLNADEIQYVLTTPRDASGGHVAVIFFESVFEGKGSIALGGRIGSIIYQETKGRTKKSGEIRRFSAEPVKDKDVKFKMVFKNIGSGHAAVTPQITIYSKGSQKMEGFAMPSAKTLPGDEIVIEEEYTLDVQGDCSAVVKVEVGGKTLERSADFSL